MEIFFFSMNNGKKYCIKLGKSLSIFMILPVVMSQYLDTVIYLTSNVYSNVLQNW